MNNRGYSSCNISVYMLVNNTIENALLLICKVPKAEGYGVSPNRLKFINLDNMREEGNTDNKRLHFLQPLANYEYIESHEALIINVRTNDMASAK